MNLADYFTPAQRAQGAADLRAAALVIKLNGWTQGSLVQRFDNLPPALSPVCAFGAFNVVVWGNPYGPDENPDAYRLPDGEYNALSKRRVAPQVALSAYLDISRWNIPAWNDAEGRTAKEVVSALEGAADALEASK